jgi:hypothetical protein
VVLFINSAGGGHNLKPRLQVAFNSVNWVSFRQIVKVFNFFVWDWDLNSGHCAHKAGSLQLEPDLQSIFALVILEMRYFELFAPAGHRPRFYQFQPPK